MVKDNKNPNSLASNKPTTGSRARNKTVMLTPDVANQMRSRLGQNTNRSGSTEKIDSSLIEEIRKGLQDNTTNEAVAQPGEPSAPQLGDIPIVDNSNVKKPGDSGETKKDAVSPPKLEVPGLGSKKDKKETKELGTNDMNKENKLNLKDILEEKKPVGSLESVPVPSMKESAPVEPPQVEKAQPTPLSIPGQAEAPQASAKPPTASSPAATGSAAGNAQQHSNGDMIRWEKESKLAGFLVTFDGDPNGDYFLLRNGRLIVSSEESKGNVLVLQDESVSPMHAIIRVADQSVLVLDQLSECGTKIEKADGEVVELSGDKATLNHGDVISFGDKTFKVCLIS